MAMTSLISLNFSYIIIVILALILLLSPSYSLNHKQPKDTLRGMVAAEKTRLGSTPPSCHNKCNECHPCMAVQVPTMLSHTRVRSSSAQEKPQNYFDSPLTSTGNRYSNYKPLGWRCRCHGHFYNP